MVVMSPNHGGDADIAATAKALADPSRTRILTALLDGRALPATVLAAEAGVSAPSTSGHLKVLLRQGFVTVETSGRHRYYRLAGPHIAAVLESLATISPPAEVRSLKQGTRAAALRNARSCYDHLAGRFGVAVTAGLVDRGALVTTDGVPGTRRRDHDPLASGLAVAPYALGPSASTVFTALGLDLDEAVARRRSRPLIRACVDWSEQQHHLAGSLGASVLDALLERDWIRRRRRHRALSVTAAGAGGLRDLLGVEAA